MSSANNSRKRFFLLLIFLGLVVFYLIPYLFQLFPAPRANLEGLFIFFIVLSLCIHSIL